MDQASLFAVEPETQFPNFDASTFAGDLASELNRCKRLQGQARQNGKRSRARVRQQWLAERHGLDWSRALVREWVDTVTGLCWLSTLGVARADYPQMALSVIQKYGRYPG